MAIKTEDRFLGEGIMSQGEKDPAEALRQHRKHIRLKRLKDMYSETRVDRKFTLEDIIEDIETILDSIRLADDQVNTDNAEFMTLHKLEAWTVK